MAKSAKAKTQQNEETNEDFLLPAPNEPEFRRKLKVKSKLKVQQSAPVYTFKQDVPLICLITGTVIPDSGEHKDKLIGYHVTCLETDKPYTIGATHAIQKGIQKALNEGYDVIADGTPVQITWHGKRNLKSGGRTFNDYTVELVELEDAE